MATINRRNLLQLVGLAGASYALGIGRSRPAHAGPSGVPKRILFFYTDQGTLRHRDTNNNWVSSFTPAVTGAPDATTISKLWQTKNFTLGDLHKPLVARKNDLLFLDGIDMISDAVDPTGGANAHISGTTQALTAVSRQSPTLAGGISIDQYIAKGINSPSPVTAVPSLEMTVNPYQQSSGGDEDSMLYAAAGERVPIVGDLGQIYDRLLPNGPTGTTAAEKAALEKIISQKKSVLQHAYVDFKSAGSKLGTLDRQRLEAHAQAIHDLESRLSKGVQAACTQPNRSIINTGHKAGEQNYPGDDVAYNANADIMMRLTQAAFACDLTRVATIHLEQAPDSIIGFKQVGVAADFHGMVHETCGGSGSPPTLVDNPDALGMMKTFHNYNAQLFANMLDLLDAIPESDGTTLLDNTLVVWCGQIGGGDHSLDHIPYILAGKMGGAVTPGRYVLYPRKKTTNWPTYSDGPAHNDLFVSLANMMGVKTNTFGNASICKGPIAGLT